MFTVFLFYKHDSETIMSNCLQIYSIVQNLRTSFGLTSALDLYGLLRIVTQLCDWSFRTLEQFDETSLVTNTIMRYFLTSKNF